MKRAKISIFGAVQGVGFRPFVYRLAKELQLRGTVCNNSEGVFIEAEGDEQVLHQFCRRLQKEKPYHAHIAALEIRWLTPVGLSDFAIIESSAGNSVKAWVLPDIATCFQCRDEIFNEENRRFLYPFTNCTNCGPRYSIIEKLPYDRPHTTMNMFEMCPACKAEYENPEDRRFHAQPNACPDCGPQIELWSSNKDFLEEKHGAMVRAAELLKEGAIVAVKGLGGFHLMVIADNNNAVKRLRERKRRGNKPFAVMFPNLEQITLVCQLSQKEIEVLNSPEAPIILLHRKKGVANNLVSAEIAPGNPFIGAMLPYTPLHYILLSLLQKPVVATSGNLSDEPIVYDNVEAFDRLGKIADYFLLHNRPILRPVDDSVVRVVADQMVVIRRARGFAPLPVPVNMTFDQVMAVGGHMKNTIAIPVNQSVITSQHIGDLDAPETRKSFHASIESLTKLYNIKPEVIIHDSHPDYYSTRFANEFGQNYTNIQHHLAHVFSAMLDNELDAPVLGFAWDGTGYGTDGTVWGGETFKITQQEISRVASVVPFFLPGGEKAVKEPRRVLLSLLTEAVNNWEQHPVYDILNKKFKDGEQDILKTMILQKKHGVMSTSIGRIFDAVSSLLTGTDINQYEGDAAQALEYLALQSNNCTEFYRPILTQDINGITCLDWRPILKQIIEDYFRHINPADIAYKFHLTLAHFMKELAMVSGLKRIVISGGCFMNSILVEQAFSLLRKARFEIFQHQQIPANDGGISAGQLYAYQFLKRHNTTIKGGTVCV